MKFESLPYEYKKYSDDKGWTPAQAVEYYRQAEEYRGFVVSRMLKDIRASRVLEDSGKMYIFLDSLLNSIRGKGVILS